MTHVKARRNMTPKYLKPGVGQCIQLLGEPRTIKLLPVENGGTYLQFETAHAPGVSVPAHAHQAEDEAFYVLAGQIEISIGGTPFTAERGAFAFAPRGTMHALTTLGPDVARMLVTVTPGTQHAGLFRKVDELIQRLGKELEPSQVAALAMKYGWVIEPMTSPTKHP
jgi:quercetin dioxygenase-like cupin family protein